jgi:hypothetical protein
MLKLLAIAAMLAYGGYKLNRKSERWIELLRPLLGAPDRTRDAAGRPARAAAGSRIGGTTEERPSAGARSLADDPPGAASPLRKRLVLAPFYALAFVGLIALGRWLTQLVVTDGYAGEGTVAEATVGRASAELAYAMLDHPVQRLLLPAWRVLEVRREPGHCTEPFPERPEIRDLMADVRIYTLFALPYRTVTVTCGGRIW